MLDGDKSRGTEGLLGRGPGESLAWGVPWGGRGFWGGVVRRGSREAGGHELLAGVVSAVGEEGSWRWEVVSGEREPGSRP